MHCCSIFVSYQTQVGELDGCLVSHVRYLASSPISIQTDWSLILSFLKSNPQFLIKITTFTGSGKIQQKIPLDAVVEYFARERSFGVITSKCPHFILITSYFISFHSKKPSDKCVKSFLLYEEFQIVCRNGVMPVLELSRDQILNHNGKKWHLIIGLLNDLFSPR